MMHFENGRDERLKEYDNEADFDFEGQTFNDYFDLFADYKILSYIKNQKVKHFKENKRTNEKK